VNIVFDLCGVVFKWTPEAILANVNVEPSLKEQVIKGLFEHSDWLELDRGTLSHQESIQRAAVYTGLEPSIVANLIPYIPRALVVMPGMINLLTHLKANGHTLYYLSNMNHDCITHLENTCSYWHIFEGGIVSCRVHALKPEPAIYKSLLETYRLAYSEILFIDDREINLDAAKQFGMQTIHFEFPLQCAEQLNKRCIL
jgi:putative hydrolase of the HAD superfamily